MFVVDTNILLYAANRMSPHHQVCRVLLDQWRTQATPWYITWGVAYEFLRVATHPAVFPMPLSLAHAWKLLDAVLSSPSLRVLRETDQHRAVAAEVFAELPALRGNLVFDARTAILMRERGIRTIYSKDADFDRFTFLTRIDPTAD